MSEVVGIKKRDKTSLLVVVAAGLEIECLDGTVSIELDCQSFGAELWVQNVIFALVSNRDHVSDDVHFINVKRRWPTLTVNRRFGGCLCSRTSRLQKCDRDRCTQNAMHAR